MGWQRLTLSIRSLRRTTSWWIARNSVKWRVEPQTNKLRRSSQRLNLEILCCVSCFDDDGLEIKHSLIYLLCWFWENWDVGRIVIEDWDVRSWDKKDWILRSVWIANFCDLLIWSVGEQEKENFWGNMLEWIFERHPFLLLIWVKKKKIFWGALRPIWETNFYDWRIVEKK